jgi:myo-inositol-1(or 4)-monophosphatase
VHRVEPRKPEDELRPTELAEFAGTVARRAGRLLMNHLPFGRFGGAIETKAGRELVSYVDRASEELLVEAIGATYPDHAVLGEEGGARLAPLESAPYRWILDPLDGTTNFLHGHPFFAVSIGVERLHVEHGPEIVAAAVFAPYFGELFVAAQGMGAFMNTPAVMLKVSNTPRLDEALVATGFAYERERWPNEERFSRASEATSGVRRCGAAALDLAYVAAGRYDGFWELGLKAHDVAAGALLVREAGGMVGGFDDGDDWLMGGKIVAAPPALFEPLRALIR